MDIVRYKKTGKNKYKITLSNNVELTIYEDVILKYELLLKKKINNKDLDKIKELNSYYEAYYFAVNSLNSKFKSISDMRRILKDKEYSSDTVESVIDKLIEQGYLNDNSFCRSFINNQIITTNRGPYKIISELNKHNIKSNIIDEEIVIFTEEEQIDKIDKIINRSIKTNKTRGGFVLKKKIINDLINLGYSIDTIDKVINKYEFKADKDIVQKEYDKIYKRLSRKYEGDELKYKIKEQLYRRGLYYED